MKPGHLKFEPIDPPWVEDGLTFVEDAHDEGGVRHHVVTEPGHCGTLWRNAHLWSTDDTTHS